MHGIDCEVPWTAKQACADDAMSLAELGRAINLCFQICTCFSDIVGATSIDNLKSIV